MRIPTKFLREIVHGLDEKPDIEEVTYYRKAGNMVATRVRGVTRDGESYDSWDFVYNPNY